MTPRVLHPEELRHYWPEIKVGLINVLEKTPTATWIPEDVYSAIQNRTVTCVLGMNEEELDGFFVGYEKPMGTFFTWAVWQRSDLKEGIEHLRNFARSLGCNRIMFQSDRPGWSRVLKNIAKPNSWVMEV